MIEKIDSIPYAWVLVGFLVLIIVLIIKKFKS